MYTDQERDKCDLIRRLRRACSSTIIGMLRAPLHCMSDTSLPQYPWLPSCGSSCCMLDYDDGDVDGADRWKHQFNVKTHTEMISKRDWCIGSTLPAIVQLQSSRFRHMFPLQSRRCEYYWLYGIAGKHTYKYANTRKRPLCIPKSWLNVPSTWYLVPGMTQRARQLQLLFPGRGVAAVLV